MKESKTQEHKITSDAVRGKLTQLLVRNEVAQAIIESWLDGRGVDIPDGMTPRVDLEFTITIVPIPPQNGTA
jgi:hypothetical protein